MRNLVIDIGNSRVKYGVFINDELVGEAVTKGLQEGDILRLATNHHVENIIYSTVATAPHTDWIEKMQRHYYVLELCAETPLPIVNAYATPTTLGKDRLAAVVAAWYLYPNRTCLVIDAGTCMTLDVLQVDPQNGQGLYLGGNISPGIQMRLQAMHQFTARLPRVEPAILAKDYGDSTTRALQNGGVLGATLEIEGLAARLERSWPNLVVVLTGGDAEMLAKRTNCKIFVHSNLVLLGLQKILTYNVEQRT